MLGSLSDKAAAREKSTKVGRVMLVSSAEGVWVWCRSWGSSDGSNLSCCILRYKTMSPLVNVCNEVAQSGKTLIVERNDG